MSTAKLLVETDDLALLIGARPILRGVDLHLGPGDIYGLLGPNGAGKTTTISALTGLRPATGGKVSVLGVDPRAQSAVVRQRIGVLPEQAGCYEWMSGPQYLSWFARLYGIDPAPGELVERLARVGLEAGDARPVGAYSRGMNQRLGHARALVNDPQLLILDEPTNGLDPRGRREIHDLLLELSRRRAVGILLCTHLLDDVDRLCNRVGILHRGRTVVEGELSDLLARERGASRYRLRVAARPAGSWMPATASVVAREGDWWHVDVAAGAQPHAVWRSLLAADWAIDEIHRESGGLESLYLALTSPERA